MDELVTIFEIYVSTSQYNVEAKIIWLSAVTEQTRFQNVSSFFRKRFHDYTPNGNKSFYDKKRDGNMPKSGHGIPQCLSSRILGISSCAK